MWHVLAQTKILEQHKQHLVAEILFVDYCALIAHTEEALQHTVNYFANAAKAFGLTISLKKIKVMYQPPPGEPYSALTLPWQPLGQCNGAFHLPRQCHV